MLRGVTFEVRAGEVLAVIGPNGAGKTTLLESIVGFQRIERGHVLYEGRPIDGLADRARVFSFMPDDADPPAELSVGAHITHALHFGQPPPGLARQIEQRLGLVALRRARCGELSRGERRRLALYSALCTSRPVAVLDEPLGTFDPLQLVGIVELLRERASAGLAVLLSIHQMSDAEKIADRVLLLDGGCVLAIGTMGELRQAAGLDNGSLEQLFLALLRQARTGARGVP